MNKTTELQCSLIEVIHAGQATVEDRPSPSNDLMRVTLPNATYLGHTCAVCGDPVDQGLTLPPTHV